MTDEHLHDTDSLNSFPYKDCTPKIVAVPPVNGNSPSVCGDYLEIGVLPLNDSTIKSIGGGEQQQQPNHGLAAILPIRNSTDTDQPIPNDANILPSNVLSASSFTERLQEIDDKIESWNNESDVNQYPVINRESNPPTNVFGVEFAAAVAGNDPIFDHESMDVGEENTPPVFESSTVNEPQTILASATPTKDHLAQLDANEKTELIPLPTDGNFRAINTIDNTDGQNVENVKTIEGDIVANIGVSSSVCELPPPENESATTLPSDCQLPSSMPPASLSLAEAIARARLRKKRRRIVQLNDDSDSDDDVHNEDRNQLLNVSDEQYDSANCSEQDDDDTSVSHPPIHDENLEDKERTPSPTLEKLKELVHNEKPGPKSKKASTQMIKEFQARALLRAAIVIPLTSGDNKRRKKRIIDDSDDEPECDVSMDVEGIGVPDTLPEEQDDEPFEANNSILLIENEQIDGDGEAEEDYDLLGDKLATDEVPESENTRISLHGNKTDVEEPTNDGSESNKEDDPDVEQPDPVGTLDDAPVEIEPSLSSPPISPSSSPSPSASPVPSPLPQKENSDRIETVNKDGIGFNSDPIVLKPISELLDPNYRLTSTNDADIDPINIPHDLPDNHDIIADVEVCQIIRDSVTTPDPNVLANATIVASSPPPQPTTTAAPKPTPKPVRKMVNPGAPFPISSTSSEEEDIPNELYFGTPDLTQLFQQARNRANLRARGRSIASGSRPITMTQKSNVARRGGGGGGTNTARRGRAAKNSQRSGIRRRSPTSSSSSDSDSSDSNRKKKSAMNRQKVIHVMQRYPQHPSKKGKKKRKRDIPNDIYFGEVQVPLHVLHSYGGGSGESGSSDSDSDSEDDTAYIRQQYISMPRGRGRGITVTHISPSGGRSGSRLVVCYQIYCIIIDLLLILAVQKVHVQLVDLHNRPKVLVIVKVYWVQ